MKKKRKIEKTFIWITTTNISGFKCAYKQNVIFTVLIFLRYKIIRYIDIVHTSHTHLKKIYKKHTYISEANEWRREVELRAKYIHRERKRKIQVKRKGETSNSKQRLWTLINPKAKYGL